MTEEKKNEKISPYDWEAFGFKIYDSDPESFFITSKSPIMQEVLKLIDANTDGDLDVEEFERVRGDQYVNAHLSKMICCHRSEWSYRGDSLVKLKNDASAIYDEIIDKASPETQEQKQKYLQLKDESIKRFEQKAKNLSFMCEFPEFKTQQLPEFRFYYFHPFAFIEQMKRMESCNKWHDPVDNPQLCLFTQGGNQIPYWGSFGEKIRKTNTSQLHAGIDIFALPGTPVYACVDGTIARTYVSKSLAGRVISLKVKNKAEFLNLKKQGFTPRYEEKGELTNKNFDEKADIYLVYMHLSESFVEDKQEVKCGDIIGKSGTSGKNGVNFSTKNPHLHLEVSNNVSNGGINQKCNPILFFNIKHEDELSDEDKNKQIKAKEKGY